MCGILGWVAPAGHTVDVSDAAASMARDRLAHRGPDGAGLWRAENVLLAHRRLAVRDLRHAADQPMLSPSGRQALVYNGELYADEELRAELAPFVRQRGGFRTSCDAETVLWALLAWGPVALTRLRGMYALAWVDLDAHQLLLARDPLGVKPLYFWTKGGEVVFASEPAAIIQDSRVAVNPDLSMLSAYLTTARRELDDRTLFEGVHLVRPGEVLACDLSAERPHLERLSRWRSVPVEQGVDEERATELTRENVTDSLVRHLRADVPMCGLLSGGLDSAILTSLSLAVGGGPEVTWCAGGATEAEELSSDFAAAREVAAELGTDHREVRIGPAEFLEGWRSLIDHLATPLSTPNEVAIDAVSARIAARGTVVALSGEGADELFGGYDMALHAFECHARHENSGIDSARFHLEATAWVPPAGKPDLFGRDAAALVDEDGFLIDAFSRTFAELTRDAGPHASTLDVHLRLQRQFNLPALLQRLDAATMRHGVEGRTPFADVEVARFAESLPMTLKYRSREGRQPVHSGGSGGATATAVAIEGKRILRRAFAGRVPEVAQTRPKASFPMPFQDWAVPVVRRLSGSPFARAIFRREALEEIAADPVQNWRRAWPVANLALWGDRWWS